MSEEKKGWYVLRAISGKENKVKEVLDAEIKNTDLGNYVFHVGETVKVNYGPFNGFSGIIEEVNNEKKKLKVMVKIFGRKTPLELENSQVERE